MFKDYSFLIGRYAKKKKKKKSKTEKKKKRNFDVYGWRFPKLLV